MTNTKAPYKNLLSDAGLRKTRQRESILEIIRNGKGHLDADEVYQRARKKQPRLSLSTVYRTLQTLKELGLIEEVRLDEAHHHYELKNSRDHYHLICQRCGKIVEFEIPSGVALMRRIGRENHFTVTGMTVQMTGLCEECREKADRQE